MENKHKLLAKKLYELEHVGYDQEMEWIETGKKEWEIAPHIYAHLSDDWNAWYIEWVDTKNHYSDWSGWKVLPAHNKLSVKQIARLLHAQPWVYW